MQSARQILAALLAMAPLVAGAGKIDVALTLNGQQVINTQKSGTSLSVRESASINNAAGSVFAMTLTTGEVRSDITVTGNLAANARATAVSTPVWQLVPPANASFAGGKLIVYAALAGDITRSGTMDLTMQVDASTLQWAAMASNSRQVVNQPGREQVEFDVAVALPATLDPARRIMVEPTLTLLTTTSIPASSGVLDNAEVNVEFGKVVAFAVLDAAGVQVTGFKLSGASKVVPERAPPPPSTARAIEYYNPSLEHYFITGIADEIAKLDAGIIKGWQRTGESFNVYPAAAEGRVAVCRFFSTSFGDKSSHFYAPRGLGCEAVLQNPAWIFEGDVFYTYLPDAAGQCPVANVPVYRLYNNGQGGAPNHRFTTNEAVRLEMLTDGYVAEGSGIGVGMCSPE